MQGLRMRERQIRGRCGAAALRLSPVAGLKRYMTSSVAPRQHPPTADGDGDAAAGGGSAARTRARLKLFHLSGSEISSVTCIFYIVLLRVDRIIFLMLTWVTLRSFQREQ